MKLKTINEANITLKQFLQAVKSYSTLDDALEKLPDDYIEFYLKNINNKTLNKELKKINLTEDFYEPYQTKTVGTSPSTNKFKQIRYKGEFIVLKYDERWGWLPSMTFRSITQATKYIKKLADEFMN